jgi:ribonucleoside-diphosphate reductase alpha chain
MNLERDNLFDELGLRRLKESYMLPNEQSPQERFKYVSEQFASNPEHAKRLYEYSSKHWLSYSTPILSYGRSRRGLPISCYLPYIDDSAEGLVKALSEVNWLSMLGGGVGIGFGIRSEDDKSVGVMPHMKVYEASSMAYSQGSTRRGSYAAYLDINHPNIVQFIEMRKPTGDHNMRCLEIHHGINITDEFMKIIENSMKDDDFDDTFELKDPNSDVVKNKVSAKWLWEKIIDTRMRTGEPYIHFISTSNNAMHDFQKNLGLKIRQSNLCLTGDTIITILTHDGVIRDIELCRLEEYMKDGVVKVRSFNQEKNEFEFREVTAFALTAKNAELMEITSDTGETIRCTPDHKIYTKNRGYVMAKYLLDTDELMIDVK